MTADVSSRTTRVRSAVAVVLLAAVAGLSSAGPAAAHESDEGIIAVVDDERVIVTAAVAFEELGFSDTSGDGVLDVDELTAQQTDVARSLVETTRSHVAVTVDGEPIEIIGAGVPSLSEDGTGSAASAHVVLVLATGPHDGELSEFDLVWDFESPSTNVVLSNADGVVTGDLGDDGSISFSLSTWSSARSFFDLGIEHIQYGPDHLLFLLVLTLAAAGTTITSATTWRTVKLVTAFTVGHAISLALAFFEVISVPAAIVEPAISLSIVAAAILAIRGSSAEARPVLAGLVGVIHGLGFASNLSTLGVAASERLAALAAFNLGVDVAQTAVVLVVIAALWLSAKVLADRMTWVRVAGAVGAAAFGLTWTASRLVELSA